MKVTSRKKGGGGLFVERIYTGSVLHCMYMKVTCWSVHKKSRLHKLGRSREFTRSLFADSRRLEPGFVQTIYSGEYSQHPQPSRVQLPLYLEFWRNVLRLLFPPNGFGKTWGKVAQNCVLVYWPTLAVNSTNWLLWFCPLGCPGSSLYLPSVSERLTATLEFGHK